MKKIVCFLSLAVVGLLFAGCANVEVVGNKNLNGESISAVGTPIAHINAQNWGFYLFSIPLLTGSTESVGNVVAFQDTVNVESLVPVVTGKSRMLRATQTLDLASQYSDVGLIFYVRSVNVSANAVR